MTVYPDSLKCEACCSLEFSILLDALNMTYACTYNCDNITEWIAVVTRI